MWLASWVLSIATIAITTVWVWYWAVSRKEHKASESYSIQPYNYDINEHQNYWEQYK